MKLLRRHRHRPLSEHPIQTPHPWGEDRSWCTRCGGAAICDDLAFAMWHVDDGTPANVRCERRRMTTDAKDLCEPGTGWPYCHHADDSLTICRCSCTCLDQRHCPTARAEGSK